jgi:hypothetical protein
MLWGDKHYTENIGQFLVGADGRYVALVGTNYHYVFVDNSGMFKEILALNQKGILNIDVQQTYLKLERNNDIRGHIVIKGPFNILSPQDKVTLISLGVRPDSYNNVEIKINLAGKRYSSRYLGHTTSRPTNTSYTLTVYYNSSSMAKDVGKIAITPIAVTLDAVLLIGKIVVYPLSFGG